MITMHFTVEDDNTLHCQCNWGYVVRIQKCSETQVERSLVYYEVELKSDEVAFVP